SLCHRYSSLFFFHCHGHPRDLHSFPTRALPISSPTFSPAFAGGRPSASFATATPPVDAMTSIPASAVSKKWTKFRGKWSFSLMRSEEHTSELQSRFDLVCRLLLEKKKSY